MHTETGEIREFTHKEIFELPQQERKKWVGLTAEQNKKLQGMNRKDRRAYFKKHKKEFNGLSWGEVTNSQG